MLQENWSISMRDARLKSKAVPFKNPSFSAANPSICLQCSKVAKVGGKNSPLKCCWRDYEKCRTKPGEFPDRSYMARMAQKWNSSKFSAGWISSHYSTPLKLTGWPVPLKVCRIFPQEMFILTPHQAVEFSVNKQLTRWLCFCWVFSYHPRS